MGTAATSLRHGSNQEIGAAAPPRRHAVRRVCVLDFDGPVNDEGPLRKWADLGLSRVFSFDHPRLEDDIPVSNFELLKVWFTVLVGVGVVVVPGSQRCALKKDNPAYLQMYQLFDELFGIERSFFLQADGDKLAEGITILDLKQNKNPMLRHVALLPGCKDVQPADIVFVDDTAESSSSRYKADAETEGFRFVHCVRDCVDPDKDSRYLAESMLIATQDLCSPEVVLDLIRCHGGPGAERLGALFAKEASIPIQAFNVCNCL